LVDVVVRDHLGIDVPLGPVEVVERDLGPQVVTQCRRRAAVGPVREREHRVGVHGAVDHHVRDTVELAERPVLHGSRLREPG
jgi:hypothetical protein